MSDDPTIELGTKPGDTAPTMTAVMERINALGEQLTLRMNELEQNVKHDIASLRADMSDRFEAVETRLDKIEGMTLTLRSEFREFRREVKERMPDLESKAS